tara:strand:+ start:3673 stop:4821 length:1149 start_codon:yes stop_codon:yes gene_type:complete
MKKILFLLMFCPFFVYSQNTFLKRNIDTKWINGENELSFLEKIDPNSYKAVSSNSFIFFINLDKDVYSIEELERERLLNCCMCSYTAIILNTKDTLQIEKGQTDDFGNSDIVTNTFYIQENQLVQVKVIDNESPIVTIWSQVSSEIDNIKFKNKRYYSNSFTPLLFREEPKVNSKILSKIKYGEEVTINDVPLTKHDLKFDFSTNFRTKHKNITYQEHIIQSYYVKANYKGQIGYVFFGLLSKKQPIDFSIFFKVRSLLSEEIIINKLDEKMLISEEYIEKGMREYMAFERTKIYKNNIIVTEYFNGKYTLTTKIELPIESRDEFYILSNNLFRYLNTFTFGNIYIGVDNWGVSFSEMGPSIGVKISEEGKKIYISYTSGGC